MNTRYYAVMALMLTVACGGRSHGNPTPVIDPPQIACPADMSVAEVAGIAQEITFPAPTVTGGASPVSTTCTPASGASFPLGTTPVNCVASDAQSRQATCSFKVTLAGFTLAAKKFVAVGDSLTAGENGLPSVIDAPNSYPTKLQASLDAFYPGQGITVINRGRSGDPVGTTYALLPGILNAERPDAVLLLSGYNNLTLPCGPGQGNTPACRAAVEQEVPFGVRDCIRRVKESAVGVKFIFVSTLTPPGSGPKRIDAGAIMEANKRIRLMVASERATLVDSYAVFVGHEAEYVSVDGLHLQPAGYQALADAFLAAIKATVPQTPVQPIAGLR